MNSASTPSALTLRQAGWGELDQVMEVMTAAFDPSFGEAWTRAQCGGILPMSGVSMTLAQDSGPPLGFSLARQVADEAELLLLAVSPGARGRGVGASLLCRFIDAGRDARLNKLHLEVRDGNPAVNLYRHHGFAVEGRRPKYYKGPGGQFYDALTMVRFI